MIKKIGFVVLTSAVLTIQSLAHDFWVDGNNSSTFKGIIGYGHEFPYPEKISKDRVKNVADVLSIGQELEVKVLKVKKDRIELSSN